jgi:hypothetical protein
MYNGLRVKSDWDTGPGGSSDGEYDTSGTWTWFECDHSYLDGQYNPSKLLQLFFGTDLSIGTDGWISQLGWVPGAGSFSTEADLEYTESWRQSITVAYLIGGVITNLPPISQTIEAQAGHGTVSGFLDWNKPWGLTYNVDVMYKSGLDIWFAQAVTEARGVAQTSYSRGVDFSTRTDEALTYGTGDAPGLVDLEWLPVDDVDVSDTGVPNSMFPRQATLDLNHWGLDGSVPHSGRPTPSTYAMEALGYDAYDKLPVAIPATYYESLDANEAMHSNEIYRFNTLHELEGIDSAVLDTAPSFTVTSPSGFDGVIRLNWVYPPSILDEFAGAYHASYDVSDSRTQTGHPDHVGAWCKIQEQEYLDMVSAIDTACEAIGPESETSVDFPERFINHIQRKKKIPNNMVSAFGYVPGEMYTATAADVYVSGSTDTVSYDPVTGEAMDVDATWGTMHYPDGAPGWWEGEGGVRGHRMLEGDGWADDGTGGGGEGWVAEDDEGSSSPSWWDDE